jgi:predicted RNA-binding Zn ribbon-like protein
MNAERTERVFRQNVGSEATRRKQLRAFLKQLREHDAGAAERHPKP